jgi:hypothetical protein
LENLRVRAIVEEPDERSPFGNCGRSPMALRRLGLVLLVTMVAACVPAVSHAGATTTRVPLSLTIGDECGVPEPIAVEGTMTVVDIFNSQGEGVFHERFNAETHLMGTGLVSGDKYVFNASSHLAESTFNNRGALVMESDRVVEVHAGETVALDDFFLRVGFNPAGVFFEESGCR